LPDTILYTVGGGLYVNLTNRCTCACDFCERRTHGGMGSADSLWLDKEPAADEILRALAAHDLTAYRELVFCGFGEPTLRLDVLLTVARAVKHTHPALPVRINTNGHANLIAGRDVTGELAGLVDHLSVSLNRADAERYTAHMQPVFGTGSFDALLEFSRRAKVHVPRVTLTVVDVLGDDELAACRGIANSIGVGFRVRPLH
jgi:TatD family-associated radical SAM protein